MSSVYALLLACAQLPLGAEFDLLTDGGAPALRGQVSGRVPVEMVAGRWAARFGPSGWVTVPTADHFDPARGGLEALVCPTWEPETAERHTVFHVGENDARSHFTIFKTESAAIRFVVKRDPNTYAAIDIPIADWRPGEWHRIRASWLTVGQRFLMLLQVDEGEVRNFLGGKPLADVPDLAYIGRRGPARQFADAAIAQFRLTDDPILPPPVPVGPMEPAVVAIDAGQPLGPVRRVYDCTTIWNTRDRPLPFTTGDPKWRRFQQARFSLARLVAFSESWLWGVRLERNAAGEIELDFADFDRLIDTVRSAGAEPYVRLAYHMPRALSSQPDSKAWGYSPPRDPQEWDDLIRAIVHHLNVERNLGVKYFVCTLNEADIAVARHGTDWRDILDLHERTVKVARAVDPTIKVGGPAVCLPLDGVGGTCLREFVTFCRDRKLPLDFICFHRYRAAHPRDYEHHVQRVQQIVREADPELDPEWFCDEYNLWARDHTADDEYGAAYLAAAIHFLKRAGLDKLSLVSFNDILPPPSPPKELLSFDGPFDLDRAAARVARFVARTLSAGGVARRGILAHPPGPPADYTFGRYRVQVPAQGRPRLLFGTGIAATHPQMDGVGFSIAVLQPGQDPFGAPTAFDHFQRREQWTDHEVSLAGYAGQTVSIELRADRGRAARATGIADHAAWGEPRLVTGPAGQERTDFDFVEQIENAKTGTVTRGWKFVYGEEAIARSTGLPLIKGPVVTAPYFVLLMHNKLQGNELAVRLDGRGGILRDDSLGVSAARDGQTLRALAWSFSPLGQGERQVTLRFENLPQALAAAARARVKRWLIDSTHTNPWYHYVLQGQPAGESYNLTSGELAQVMDQELPLRRGTLEVTLQLPTLAVTCLEIAPVP